MRCLYCGKELALLKRLTGGEFCSDAHRQQYKEEYNQLALDRLLQAKDQPKADEDDKTEPAAETIAPSVSRASWDQPARNEPEANAFLQPANHAASQVREPAVISPLSWYAEPVDNAEPAATNDAQAPAAPVVTGVELAAPAEDPAPAALTGFVVDLPSPVLAVVAQMVAVESDLEHESKPSLPVRQPEVSETQLVEAGRVVIEASTRFRDYATRRGERGPEIREFGRSAAGVEMNWPAAGETILDRSEKPMEILVSAHPPQGTPRPWEEPEREFEAIETQLGALARIVFRTTGIEDNIDEGGAEHSSAPLGPLENDTVESRESSDVAASDGAPSLNGIASLPAPAALSSTPQPVPDLVTKPLPLTLHGLAAGRGKPVQVFSAAAAGFQVQMPRSSALPLRPVMILGPAPASAEPTQKVGEKKEPERTAVKNGSPVTHSRKPSVTRPDSRPGATTVRKLDARALQPETRQSEKTDLRSPASSTTNLKEQPGLREQPGSKQKPGPEAGPNLKNAPIAAVEAKPEKLKPESRTTAPQAPARIPTEPAPEAPKPARPAPLSAPQTPLDLGLPSLDLRQPSGNLWSRIPMSAKIGVAAAVLIVAGVIATASVMYFSKRGPRVVEAGPPLAVSGWVKDWGTGPQIQVTVLQGTTSLSDYRAQFQAQIDTKAVGWVFRAKDPKNFYASKLEVVKTGAIWTAMLARFAVIDGHEEPRAHVPLSLVVQENTVYKVRLEAVGDHFSTWIQDQKVDEFTDDRIKSGGVGLYSERGESALLKGDLKVIPLVIKR